MTSLLFIAVFAATLFVAIPTANAQSTQEACEQAGRVWLDRGAESVCVTGPGSAEATANRNNCDAGGSILGFPTWWEYMDVETGPDGRCRPVVNDSKDLLPIGIALLEIMLRVAGLLAVTFIIVGGFKYILSQGEPDKAKSAKGTILNAIIGLVITMAAAIIVSFIGRNIGAS